MVHSTADHKITSFSATLKDGTQIRIREAVIQDAVELIRCVKSYISDSDHLVMEPDEFAPDLAQGRAFIQNLVETENSLLLVAEQEEKIVGNLDISGGRRKRLTHTGLIGMGMLQDFRSKGLGTLLLKAGIKWAQKNPLLEKLWLQIRASNENALQLFKKMQFSEEGRQKDFIRIGKENYDDNVLMALNVK